MRPTLYKAVVAYLKLSSNLRQWSVSPVFSDFGLFDRN